MTYFDGVPRPTEMKGEFEGWLKYQTSETQTRIINRLGMIHESGHYGEYRDLFDTFKGLYELKFKRPAIRIYFTVEKKVLLWAGSHDKGGGVYSQEAVLRRLPTLYRRLIMKEKTWIDTWAVDEEYLLKINFDDDDPDFGVGAVLPEVRRKAQLSAIIKVATKTNHLDLASAAKAKDADPAQLYRMLRSADEIESLSPKKVDGVPGTVFA